MKLIKKNAAIMFAFMMVLSMSCNVKAADTGKITIDKAVDGQTYTIYKLLDLESYTPDPGTDDGIYSYKPNELWKNFLESAKDSAGTKYFDINENGYATWNGNQDDSRRAKFAQEALAYAKDEQHAIRGISKEKEKGITLSFSGLSLGYYLVESNVGALCSLDTTRPTVTIQEKNGVPSVEKKILETNNTGTSNNYANIGDVVKYQTIITAQKGAQSYVLHDTMTEGLTFKNDVQVKVNGQTNNLELTRDYEVVENPTHGCTFDIKFTDTFLNSIKGETQIEVTYSATLNENAEIHDGNKNTTYLTYGNNNKTNPSETTTITYEIKVLKYTNTKDHPLADAKFSLYDKATDGNVYKLVQKTGTQDYRLLIQGESGVTEVTEITTTDTGTFSIQGLKPGTYWLEETAAPKGYNKLAKRIKVQINDDGTLIVDNKDKDENNLSINQVNVENKSGTLLPHTGGAGTTMIYLVGALLVLGSGVVLASKRRSNSK